MDSAFWVDPKSTRSMEKRREKSRQAARGRRQLEHDYLEELLELLPVNAVVKNQLDKSSIVRLVRAFMQGAHLLKGLPNLHSNNEELNGKLVSTLTKDALDGFALVLAPDGTIVYVSEQVTKFLGLTYVELMGQNMFEMTHPCDHNELRRVLSASPRPGEARLIQPTLFLRLKSTLTNKGRSVNIKAASYSKVMMIEGSVLEYATQPTAALHRDLDGDDVHDDKASLCSVYVGLCHEIASSVYLRTEPDKRCFKSRHNMDFTFEQVEAHVRELLGYSPNELVGKSFSDYYHAADKDAVDKYSKQLLVKGQVSTEPFRFLARTGGYAWVQSSATVLTCQKTGKQKYITFVHELITDVQASDLVLSVHQQSVRGLVNSLTCPANATGVVLASPNHSPPPTSAQGLKPIDVEAIRPLDIQLPRVDTKEDMESFFKPLDISLEDQGYDFDQLAPALDDALVPLDIETQSDVQRLLNFESKSEVDGLPKKETAVVEVKKELEDMFSDVLLPGGIRGSTLSVMVELSPVGQSPSSYDLPDLGASPTHQHESDPLPELDDLSLKRTYHPIVTGKPPNTGLRSFLNRAFEEGPVNLLRKRSHDLAFGVGGAPSKQNLPQTISEKSVRRGLQESARRELQESARRELQESARRGLHEVARRGLHESARRRLQESARRGLQDSVRRGLQESEAANSSLLQLLTGVW